MSDHERHPHVHEDEPRPHGLTPYEVDKVCEIVDARPEWQDKIDAALAKVTHDNAEAVLDDGERRIKETRLVSYDDQDNELSLDGQFTALLDRASRQSHTLLCSANKEADIGWLRANLDRLAGPDSAEARAADAILERQHRLNRLMSQLYKCEILRRIGLAKRDDFYIDQGRENFARLKPEAAAALAELEAADSRQFPVFPEAGRSLASLRRALENADAGAFAESFYEEIAAPLSDLIGYDLEEFNEKSLTENLRKIGR